MRPTVSIVLAVFNESEFIKEAIWSILRPYDECQGSFPYRLEVIVVDDFSTDATVEVLSSIRHPCLRVIGNKYKGKVAAYNVGLSNAVGDFIILFAGDDRFNLSSVPERIQPIVGAIGPAVSLCALQSFRSSDGMLLRRYPRVGGGARAGGAIAKNRAFLGRCFTIPESLPNEDSWLCLHADYLATVLNVDVIGSWYRIHEGNTSFCGSSNPRRHRSAVLERSIVYSRFLEKHIDRLSDKQRVLLLREIAAHALARSGNLLAICAIFGYPLFRRLRAACLSSPLLWQLRTMLFP